MRSEIIKPPFYIVPTDDQSMMYGLIKKHNPTP